MSRESRLFGFGIEHPTARERDAGARSRLTVSIEQKHLKGGGIDTYEVSEDEMLEWAKQALQVIQWERKLRPAAANRSAPPATQQETDHA